jgi:carbohydrate diacid regulator
MSSRVYQTLVNQFGDVTEFEIGVLDESGLINASSNESSIGTTIENIQNIISSKDAVVVINGITYQKVVVKGKLELIAYICASDSIGKNYLAMFAINLINFKYYNDDKFDKANFIKNIILDNILPGEILLRARELHLDYNAIRVVYLIKTGKTKDIYAHDIIQSLFPNRAKDFVVILDDEKMVLVKDLKKSDDEKEVEKTAKIIMDALNSEMMVNAFVGIGSIIDNIRDIGRSFKEARLALTVGHIFESEKKILDYNHLGIGRLIYQIPRTLCELFLKEVFKENTFESFDTETIQTIQKFFENNLNVSETSRQLYVHRNTLVYRLDKIQKMTGLDLRNFDDAITFKVAILVKNYLDKGSEML